MDMTVSSRSNGGRLILKVKGDLVGPAVAGFMKELDGLQNADCSEIWVDLGEVEEADSKALGAAAYSHIVLTKASKRVVFLAPDRIRERFCECNLDRVLNIVSLEEIVSPEAIASGPSVSASNDGSAPVSSAGASMRTSSL